MGDLFSVPLGYVSPNQAPDGGMALPAIPDEVFEHRGKWVAFRGSGVLAVADTEDELLEELGDRRSNVLIFHVPETTHYALSPHFTL